MARLSEVQRAELLPTLTGSLSNQTDWLWLREMYDLYAALEIRFLEVIENEKNVRLETHLTVRGNHR